MNIALCHFRVGETDGVSLEMDKWKIALEKLGHQVFYIAGSKGTTKTVTYLIEELHYLSDRNNKIVKNAYERLADFTESELVAEIFSLAVIISEKLKKIILVNRIDLIVPNNIWSLGWGLSAGIGFAMAVKELQIPCVAHHHDFYWEREKYSKPTSKHINEILEVYFPPRENNVIHVVINGLAQEEMKKRKNLKTRVVPNVFDFEGKRWETDDYNKDFREAIGSRENDLLILQATRIVKRKAIELAIDVTANIRAHRAELTGKILSNGSTFSEKSAIKLVLAGLPEDEPVYINLLKEKARAKKVDLVLINEKIEHSRCMRNGQKCYSLWDAYLFADLVTYPSILEGWGNQFLEGLFAEKPMLVYEYPVYERDLKKVGFNIISLGNRYQLDQNNLVTVDEKIIKKAAQGAIQYLIDQDYRKEKMKENYNLGLKYFSYTSLQKILKELFCKQSEQGGGNLY